MISVTTVLLISDALSSYPSDFLAGPSDTFDTFLMIELMNAHLYSAADLQEFELDAREAIRKIVENSHPMIVSSLDGRVYFTTGMFVKNKSKCFISRFNTQTDVAKVWKSRMYYQPLSC